MREESRKLTRTEEVQGRTGCEECASCERKNPSPILHREEMARRDCPAWPGILSERRILTQKEFFFRDEEEPMTDWFARPVLHVTNLEASLRFYVDRLGFTIPWRFDKDGVAQVDRQG